MAPVGGFEDPRDCVLMPILGKARRSVFARLTHTAGNSLAPGFSDPPCGFMPGSSPCMDVLAKLPDSRATRLDVALLPNARNRGRTGAAV
jgi:hypothetical protein